MLLQELNLKALCVSASSVLPVVKTLNVEGKELEFKITDFKSGFGSGKKTVISGAVECKGIDTKFIFENSDIEKVRRFAGLAAGVSKNGRFKSGTLRASRTITEVKKLSENFKTARAVFAKCDWVKIDVVDPLLSKIAKLSPEERALLLASLQ